jgi:hypothetical protein
MRQQQMQEQMRQQQMQQQLQQQQKQMEQQQMQQQMQQQQMQQQQMEQQQMEQQHNDVKPTPSPSPNNNSQDDSKKEDKNDMESLFNTMINSIKQPSIVIFVYLLLSNNVSKNLLTKMLPNKSFVVTNQDKILYILTGVMAGILFFIIDKNVN